MMIERPRERAVDLCYGDDVTMVVTRDRVEAVLVCKHNNKIIDV